MAGDAEHFWGPDYHALRAVDPEIAQVVDDELERLRGPLQHLTLASRDPEAIERFYTEQLGLLTSDTVRDADGRLMVCWMRTNHEHHTLSCFRHSQQGIDHHSYEAGDWSVIKDWCDRSSWSIPTTTGSRSARSWRSCMTARPSSGRMRSAR